MSEQDKKTHTSRRKRCFRKGLILVLTVLLVFSAASMLASAVIFRVLFPRRDGTSDLRYSYSEIDAAAYPRETFTFESGGNTLQGYRYPVPDPKGCVVVVGGIFDDADAHLPEIMYFTDHGWSVICWDATGVGASEGRGTIGLKQIKEDLCAFLSSDAAHSEIPIVLYGHSAGAYASLSALSGGFPIDAAVSICAFNSPTEIMRYQAKEKVGILADLEYPFMRLECWFLFGGDADQTALESVNAVQTPVLLIEGSSDDYVTSELGLIRYDGSFQNPNVRCLEIRSAWRSEHATPWLSEAAAEYVCTFPGSGEPDKALANSLDPEFMSEILTFFEQSIAENGGLQP